MHAVVVGLAKQPVTSFAWINQGAESGSDGRNETCSWLAADRRFRVGSSGVELK